MHDLVLTSSKHPVTDVQVIDYCLSDHSSVIFNVYSEHRVILEDSTPKHTRDFRKFDVQRFKCGFNQLDLNISSDDPNQLLLDYTTSVTSVLDQLCPKVARRPRQRLSKPWYDETIHAMRQLLYANE